MVGDSIIIYNAGTLASSKNPSMRDYANSPVVVAEALRVMTHVFLVGCARTGSKLHADILNAHPDINLVDELHFMAPKWIRRDFREFFERHAPLNGTASIEALLDDMYSGRPNGTFWSVSEGPKKPGSPNRISDIDRQRLFDRLETSDRSLKAVFQSVVEEHAAVMGKPVAGAKFPVDLNFVPTLVDWFPDARIIHLIRDPRAVLSSMVAYEIKHSGGTPGFVKRQSFLARRFLFAANRFRQAAKVHRALHGSSNYFLSRFESLLKNPEQQTREMTQFLGIDFVPEMLSPRIRNSSYQAGFAVAGQGFDESTLSRWRNHLSPVTAQLLSLITASAIREFDYPLKLV